MLTRKKVIKVKLESTKGTKETADQAILVYDLDIKPTAPYEARTGTGLYLGHTAKGILGERIGTCSFSTELRGNGTTGIETGLAVLLQAAGFKKTSEVYNTHSSVTDQKTITIDVWEDGIKKSLYGAMGTVEFDGTTGKRLMLKFEFSGAWSAVTDEAMPAYAPSTATPMKLMGGSFKVATVATKIGKFNLNLGNQVVPSYDVNAVSGVAHYQITDYDPSIGIDPDGCVVATYDHFGIWLAGTEAAVELILNDGTTKVTFAIPKVQYKEIASGDRDGIHTFELTGQCNNSSGDDAITLTAAAV